MRARMQARTPASKQVSAHACAHARLHARTQARLHARTWCYCAIFCILCVLDPTTKVVIDSTFYLTLFACAFAARGALGGCSVFAGNRLVWSEMFPFTNLLCKSVHLFSFCVAQHCIVLYWNKPVRFQPYYHCWYVPLPMGARGMSGVNF